MSSQDHPPKGAPVLTDWLRGLSIHKEVRHKPTNQTSPIFQFPDEIFVNILSNFQIYRPEDVYYRIDVYSRFYTQSQSFDEVYGMRSRVLLAFTQVCRSMRQKFLPWLWERWHCFERDAFVSPYKMLVATPSLAVYVRTFVMHIYEISVLTRLLPLLPNLETLEVFAGYCIDAGTEQFFESVKLPQVRMLVTDAYVHFLMKCCTNVERVIHGRWHSMHLESISFVVDSLVYLALRFPEPHHIRELVLLCPNLEEFGIIQPISSSLADCISVAQGFKKLRLLEVVFPGSLHTRGRHTPLAWRLQMKEHAITVLGKISGHTKILKMISPGSTHRYTGLHVETQIITVP